MIRNQRLTAFAVAVLFLLGTLLVLAAGTARAQFEINWCSTHPDDPFCLEDPPPVDERICPSPIYYEVYDYWFEWQRYYGWEGYENPNGFYCWHEYNGATIDVEISRLAITETSGFGFTMEKLAGAEPSYASVTVFPDARYTYQPVLRGELDGSEFEITLGWYCALYLFRCDFFYHELRLGDGWVADNGIDFSNTTHNFPSPGYPADVVYWGPIDAENRNYTEPPVDLLAAFSVSDPGPIGIDTFFGIGFDVDLEPAGFTEIPLPEPGFGLSLAVPVLGLIARARIRRASC